MPSTQCELTTRKNHLLTSGLLLPSRMMSVLRLVLRNCGPLAANMFGFFFSPVVNYLSYTDPFPYTQPHAFVADPVCRGMILAQTDPTAMFLDSIHFGHVEHFRIRRPSICDLFTPAQKRGYLHVALVGSPAPPSVPPDVPAATPPAEPLGPAAPGLALWGVARWPTKSSTTDILGITNFALKSFKCVKRLLNTSMRC